MLEDSIFKFIVAGQAASQISQVYEHFEINFHFHIMYNIFNYGSRRDQKILLEFASVFLIYKYSLTP